MNPNAKNPPVRERARAGAAVVLTSLALAAPLAAEVEFPAPNWSTAGVQEAVAAADATAILAPLFERARRGEGPELVDQLTGLMADEALPLPARERILFDFAQGLGDLAPGTVGPAVIDYLMAYSPRTLVPHPDNARVGTPLYNVRAAAAGSLNAWQRQAGYEAAMTLFSGADAGTAARYLERLEQASPPHRLGLLDALPSAPRPVLSAIAEHALAGRPDSGRLNVAAARSALLLGDSAALARILAAGRGPDLAALLREAGARLDEPARIDLLFELLDTTSPSSAGLALGTLAPGLAHRPEIADRLLELVADPGLGAAAALALAQSDSADARARLSGLAAGEGPSASRAAVALEIGGGRPGGRR